MTQSMARALKMGAMIAALTTSASAQATRTWVSGVGDDANPCSRTAPCKTFAGAISKTASGGEISVLDPGGFGTLTITKSITIDGAGQLGSVLASAINGITVNAPATDTVILRNIAINGAGSTPGLNGIRILSANRVIIDHVAINSFSQNAIAVVPTTDVFVSVTDTTITGVGTGISTGIQVTGMAGTRVNVSADRVSIRNTVNGIDAQFGSTLLSNSVVANTTGVGLGVSNTGTLTSEGNMVTGNNIAAQANTGATLRLANSAFYDNLTGFGCGGGTIASAGNNRKSGNVGGSVAVCTPTATITLQ
jgi:hypothetical protein